MRWWNHFSRQEATPAILKDLAPGAIMNLSDKEVTSLLALEACRVVHRKEGGVPVSQKLSEVVSGLVEMQVAIAAAIKVEGITLEQAKENPRLYLPDWLNSREFITLMDSLAVGCRQIGRSFHLNAEQVAALHRRIEEWVEAQVYQKADKMIATVDARIQGVLGEFIPDVKGHS